MAVADTRFVNYLYFKIIVVTEKLCRNIFWSTVGISLQNISEWDRCVDKRQ